MSITIWLFTFLFSNSWINTDLLISLLFLPQVHGEVIPPLARNRDASRLGEKTSLTRPITDLKRPGWLSDGEKGAVACIYIYIYTGITRQTAEFTSLVCRHRLGLQTGRCRESILQNNYYAQRRCSIIMCHLLLSCGFPTDKISLISLSSLSICGLTHTTLTPTQCADSSRASPPELEHSKQLSV